MSILHTVCGKDEKAHSTFDYNRQYSPSGAIVNTFSFVLFAFEKNRLLFLNILWFECILNAKFEMHWIEIVAVFG